LSGGKIIASGLGKNVPICEKFVGTLNSLGVNATFLHTNTAMHGDLGVIAEPYFDVDYNKVFYITDTGRKWNKSSMSVRDKVDSSFVFKIKSTFDLINKIKNRELPNHIIINTHPHRWFEHFGGWSQELILQNLKNIVKYLLIKINAK